MGESKRGGLVEGKAFFFFPVSERLMTTFVGAAEGVSDFGADALWETGSQGVIASGGVGDVTILQFGSPQIDRSGVQDMSKGNWKLSLLYVEWHSGVTF